ncbi:acyltransferase family protein [Streptomyces sp. NPDC048171]|uniref:acyltransferase family protein n=1 Tax=Streptomyces sp. NPDC048171 TaxID=3365504 RepID=UPI00136BFE46|nr:acyltransferase family protein [Streptomyces sp. SID5789]MZE75287.1 acyltransferase family protein [Streptomyces sp. SID5789]
MTTPPYDPAPPFPDPTATPRKAPYVTAPPPYAPVGADTAAAPPVLPQQKQARRAPVRDRYFDLLRAVALFRVVLYHLTGWAWLPVLFPSMGVMFALAGNLMARSLKRPAVQVVRGRMRRLLPPLWLLGAVGVTGMLLQGWGPNDDGHPGWWWLHLTFWILPLSDPPYAEGLSGIHGLLGDNWASDLAGPLWYIRAYLWYVLLSPLLLRALRALPWPTILAPIALSAAFQFGYLELPGERIPSALTDFSTFGACWILGMAHQEGVLKRLPRYVVPSVAPLIGALGLWYAFGEGFKSGYDLDSIPFAQAVWSFATVLLLLHVSPSWTEWPRRLRRWDRVVTLLNSRAVTIYLWHNVCILIAATVWDQLWGFDVMYEHFTWLLESPWPVLVLAWLLIGSCVVWFGWMEDVAAKRKPQLWPDGGGKAARGRPRARAAHRG